MIADFGKEPARHSTFSSAADLGQGGEAYLKVRTCLATCVVGGGMRPDTVPQSGMTGDAVLMMGMEAFCEREAEINIAILESSAYRCSP